MIVLVAVATLMCFSVVEGKTNANAPHIENNARRQEGASRCWAVTKSGNRCKRRAVSGCRYCKQHSADRAAKRNYSRCRSMTKKDVQCSNAPLPGKSYCQEHLK